MKLIRVLVYEGTKEFINEQGSTGWINLGELEGGSVSQVLSIRLDSAEAHVDLNVTHKETSNG